MESVNQSSRSIWGHKTYAVITGASRGIGKTIAIEFAKLIQKDSTMLLLARSIIDLEETRSLILLTRPDISVEVQSTDLRKLDKQHYSQLLTHAAKNIPYDLYILVHNAGTTVVDIPASEMVDAEWDEFMTMNLYSATMLTSLFLKLFPTSQHCIVNISSIAARKPLKGLVMYCAAKASRESYFKVLALENPSVNVLNYSPGPIETDMYKMVLTRCCFADIIENFRNMKATNRLVKVEDTVGKLISVLKEQNYESGATVGYFPVSDDKIFFPVKT